MSKVGSALAALRPGAQWSLSNDDYNTLQWLDQVQIKPTQQEVADKIAELDATASVETTRQTDLNADSNQQDLLNRLKTATPAQIDTWLANNVTNLAQARTVLGAIVKFLATRIQ